MSDSSQFSIFGNKQPQGANPQDRSHETPTQETPKALVVVPNAETINLEHLTLDQIAAYFPSENLGVKNATAASAPHVVDRAPEVKAAAVAGTASERRLKRRALISAPVRVRGTDLTNNSLDDITTTLNVSRKGILLVSTSAVYYRSMDVMVTFPHSKAPNAIQAEQPGRIVRVIELANGRCSVAIALSVAHHDEEFIRSSGEKVHAEPKAAEFTIQRDPNSIRPLVLALAEEASVRESLKTYLASEGYDVITVTNAQEARDVLNQCTPALLIAEIEGEGMPGYDICAHCKATPRLQRIPVMLMTSSAYPSDYASAHSVGAVVCMAKPYRQDRLGHVVRLLAPPPVAGETVNPPRAADPSRRHLANGTLAKPPLSNVGRRFRFGWKS
jgi:CheY-like chemotaxis protein